MAEQTDTDSLNEDRLDKNISRNVPEIFNRSNDSPSREKDTSTETTITETDSDNDQGLDENTSTPENSNKNKNKRKRKNNNKNSTFTEDEDPSSDYEEDYFRRITRRSYLHKKNLNKDISTDNIKEINEIEKRALKSARGTLRNFMKKKEPWTNAEIIKAHPQLKKEYIFKVLNTCKYIKHSYDIQHIRKYRSKN